MKKKTSVPQSLPRTTRIHDRADGPVSIDPDKPELIIVRGTADAAKARQQLEDDLIDSME